MVSTHAPTYPTAETQIDILVQEGVAPERIVVGHTDTVKSLDYSLDLLGRGVYIEYDCMMAVKAGGAVNHAELDRRVAYLRALGGAGPRGADPAVAGRQPALAPAAPSAAPA